jgi:dihydrofolate synthase / folylpolyglutamate synthase
MTHPQYKKCLDEMFGLRRFGIKLGLGTIRKILAGIENPQDRFSCIHVAGTNGKGSIASALSTILRLSGYRVGLYTSPHLVRFNERICIDNQPITDEQIVSAYLGVKNAVQTRREPTFFEYTTAMALWTFKEAKVDWAVIETGMGGRLDATNVITPSLCIISNISLEHREYLGNTIAQIASEKGGIIKRKVPVITGARQPAAVDVIERIAESKSAPFFRLGRHFKITRHPDRTFSYRGLTHHWQNLKTGLSGSYQADNAALVLAACELLNRKHADLSEEQIRIGLENNRWPGRLEVVSTTPLVILDGAHNLAGAKHLAQYLKDNFQGRPITLVIGILSDKPYVSMLKCLVSIASKVVLTSPVIDRALPVEALLSAARNIASFIEVIPNVGEAVTRTMDEALPEDVICVAGSLYVVGEAKEALEKRGIPSFELSRAISP